eukprot:CAMPEP_0194370840 /NCGR_PEP_ID=MMETSP0174-20130528/19194_1 /TAXON_ID=216777 /ORGANISM="Proboscia alata, Strain PI-D3" /LENGTH=421 /DNA_ID=CAMNT_0039148553 /DNA_START=152 /DNA_END=1417 /DNA_ORIENTATION=-
MGNEAGDADSIVSALCLAYIKSFNATTPSNSGSCIHVPIVSIPREDMALRRDVLNLLELAGIEKDDLLYINDPIVSANLFVKDDAAQDYTNESYTPKLQITLVDHNKLRSSLREQKFYRNVVEILDHHVDELAHAGVTGDSRQVAFDAKESKALVGSTCTLVTECYMRYYEAEINKGGGSTTKGIDSNMALLLLGVILLDTNDMSTQSGKGTPRDSRAIQFLMDRTDWNHFDILDATPTNMFVTDSDGAVRTPNRPNLYAYLHTAKFDAKFWNDMTTKDALRIDYKQYEDGATQKLSFGLSSVLLPISNIVNKKEFYKTAANFTMEQNIDMLGIMSLDIKNGTPQRELLLLSSNQQLVIDVTEYLTHDPSTSFLKLSTKMQGGMVDSECYFSRQLSQGNSKGSRKQVAPVLQQFFADYTGE